LVPGVEPGGEHVGGALPSVGPRGSQVAAVRADVVVVAHVGGEVAVERDGGPVVLHVGERLAGAPGGPAVGRAGEVLEGPRTARDVTPVEPGPVGQAGGSNLELGPVHAECGR